MLTLKEPVRVVESELYSVVLEDADGISHFWHLNGDYDGYCYDYPFDEKNEGQHDETLNRI